MNRDAITIGNVYQHFILCYINYKKLFEIFSTMEINNNHFNIIYTIQVV